MKFPGDPVLRGKLIAESFLCSPRVGHVIASVTRDRIRNNGLDFRTEDPAYSHEVKARLFWNLYERAEIKFIKRYLSSDLDVVELGGSLGITAAHVLSQLDAGARYVVVEANPFLLSALEANLERHGGGTSWAIEYAAVTDQTGKDVPFVLAESSYASRLSDGGRRDGESVRWVPGMSLGDIVERHDVRSYCLISDIEGAEATFVYGDGSPLDRCEQALIEFHDTLYQGGETTADEMKVEFANRHRFQIVEEHGPVALFRRSRRIRS